MMIYWCVRVLVKEKFILVFVFVEDVVVFGGYMLVLVVDEIYVDLSLVIGFIGVVFVGFGFDKLIEKIGVDWCLYMVGISKVMLDVF